MHYLSIEEMMDMVSTDDNTLTRIKENALGILNLFYQNIKNRMKMAQLPRSSKQQVRLAKEIQENEEGMELLLQALEAFCESLRLNWTRRNGETATQFAAALAKEYVDYQRLYAASLETAIDAGMPFVLNEHMLQTKSIMTMSTKAVNATEKAIAAFAVPGDIFALAGKVTSLGTREYKVRKRVPHAANADTVEITGCLCVRNHETNTIVSVRVPVTYVPDNNKYFILEDDYKRYVSPVGIPIARIDFSYTSRKKSDSKKAVINAKAESLAKKYGYSMKDEDNIRQNALRKAYNAGVSKDSLRKTLEFLQAMAMKESSKHHKYYSSIVADIQYLGKLENSKKTRMINDLDILVVRERKERQVVAA